MTAADADAEALALSLDQPRPFLVLLPLELLFDVADLLPDRSLAALALASSSMHGMLRERLYERFKKSTFWWKNTHLVPLNQLCSSHVKIGPVHWAATRGREDLLARLLAEQDVLPPPLLRDLQGTRPCHHYWGEPSLLTCASLGGNEAIVRLFLARARHLPGVDLSTPLSVCSNQRVFNLLANEASRRLKTLGFG